MIAKDDDDSGDIAGRILKAWIEGMSLRQIATVTNRPLVFVNRILKQEQKKIVRRGGASYGRGNQV